MIHPDIIARYKSMLNEAYEWVIPVCNVTDPTGSFHLMWMLNEIETIDDSEKAMRWLGFVQGCVISQKLTTVDAERDFTRPYFKK